MGTKTTTSQSESTATATLEYLDPKSVTIGANMRTSDAEAVIADTAFIESIKSQGVLVPVLAYRDGDATVVLAGKRRTLAAAHTEQPLPAVVHSAAPADIDRLIAQWDENERREPMTEADRLAGIEQMTLLGLSVAQVTQRTHHNPDAVTAAVAVAKSDTARSALVQSSLTLEQAASLIEFEDDAEVIASLSLIAGDTEYDFDHTVATIRQDRLEAAAITEATETLTAEGITIVERPDYDSATIRLSQLVDADSGERLDEESHRTCPGHVVWLTFDRWGETPGASAHPACADPKSNGHRDAYSMSIGSGAARSGQMTEEEKAERRTVVANNKAWDAATEVRRAFLTKVAQRKTPPSGAEALVSAAVAQVGNYGTNKHPHDAWAALSIDGAKIEREVKAKNTTAKRHTVITLAVALGQWEAAAGRHTWRNPSLWDSRVMKALVIWGYSPSEVEAIVSTKG